MPFVNHAWFRFIDNVPMCLEQLVLASSPLASVAGGYRSKEKGNSLWGVTLSWGLQTFGISFLNRLVLKGLK